MKTLRCMAYPQDGVFVAACLDLSLAAQADTMQEAKEKLDMQIRDYLDEAISEPLYTQQMLNRKAPLSVWVKYWTIAILVKLRRNRGSSKLFTEHCEAVA
ncbi:DUF1902 domain-containing protein [Enterobacter ludwigii]|uniref:DUF1902 domain-containing protein n=1 Tax=Enterobacter ludwigii TaxID=299767 RepID=UPI00064348CF|nr:DUF1902 domain-containing protein [Enterobacter ludwigii]KLP38643.1 hypothetical protein ABR36_11615 [Enterobacter ludwigii]